MAAFPAFLDTCSLYGAYLCDTLLRLAEGGTYRPLWSAGVLEELQRALANRGLPEEAIAHRIAEMQRSVHDFPASSVEAYDIAVLHPEEFLLDQLDLYPGVTVAQLRAQAASYKSPEMTVEDMLGRLAAAGVPKFASEARRHL